jgi:hypothetical protein
MREPGLCLSKNIKSGASLMRQRGGLSRSNHHSRDFRRLRPLARKPLFPAFLRNLVKF